LSGVLRHAIAVLVSDAKGGLGVGKAFFGGLADPFDGFGVVLGRGAGVGQPRWPPWLATGKALAESRGTPSPFSYMKPRPI